MKVLNNFLARWGVSFLMAHLLVVALILISFTSYSQVTIVGWDFEDSNNIADSGIPLNSTKTLITEGRAMSGAFYDIVGTGSRSAGLNAWNSGSDTKYWVIEFDATGYETLTLSSKQISSNNGPEYFQAEYSTDGDRKSVV